MSKKMSTLVEKFLKYGMDISSCKINNEIEKYEFFYYIQLYINEILKNESLTYMFEDNLYILHNGEPLIAFAITSDYRIILPVALTTQKDKMCFNIVQCFLLMIKDMSEIMPYVISDVVGNTQEVLNKIKNVNIYNKNDKKYDLKKILKEMKKI
tara:strand:+ start:2487 stop:2948 length:462 start_codon:yes stop_codon:yes gene_type:complete